MTKLVVGLGNPGSRYEHTRHNVGFMVLDETARRLGVVHWKIKHGAFISSQVAPSNVVLVKPQTFMNASGEAVAPLASWWKTPRPAILVVYDELDLPFGRLRMRDSGSSGGHNGVKSLIECLHGEDFPRLRIGIGRGTRTAIDHVLSPFMPDELERVPRIIVAAVDGVERWLEGGTSAAMPLVNGWRELA